MITTILSMIGASGCMGSANQKSIEEKKNIALQYLEESYDDTFTAKGYESKSWAYDYDSLFFYSDKFSDTFCVRIIENDTKVTFKDNYLRFYLNNSAIDYFKSIASNYGVAPDIKLEFISEYLTAEKGTRSFEDFIKSHSCTVEVCFISTDEYSDEVITALVDDISNANVTGIIRFVTVKNSLIINDLSMSDILSDNRKIVVNQKYFSIGKEGISQLN